MARNRPMGFDGGMGGIPSRFTRTGRRIAIYYAAVFLIGVLTTHWLGMPWFPTLLALNPLESGLFAIWQPLTHLLVYMPLDLFHFLLNMLMLWMFSGQVEAMLGRGRFLRMVFGIPFLAGLLGLPFTLWEPLRAPFAGFSVMLDVMIVAFCVMNRNATMNFFFVLPMKAIQLIWVVIAFQVLSFLLRQNPWLAYQLIAVGLTWLSVRRGIDWDPEILRLRWKAWQLRRKQSRFSVIHGGRDEDDNGPLYH